MSIRPWGLVKLSVEQFRADTALQIHVCPEYGHRLYVGRWSSGMILASGARGRGFNSRTAPSTFLLRKKKHKCEESALVICSQSWVLSSAVEHGIADPAVAGSIPAVPFFLHQNHSFNSSKNRTSDRNHGVQSLWPNWTRRLTTNQKIGGSSPSRDSFLGH